MSVSGFSFWMHGWNRSCVLEHVDTSISESGFRYVIEPYTLYLVFNILGLYIEKSNGVWGMRRENDVRPFLTKIHDDTSDPNSPFGVYVSFRMNQTVYFTQM